MVELAMHAESTVDRFHHVIIPEVSKCSKVAVSLRAEIYDIKV